MLKRQSLTKRPHLKEDERTFRIIRKGLEIVWHDPRSLEKTTTFVRRHLPEKKAHVWEKILKREGFQDEVFWLLKVSSFEDLPQKVKNWWTIYAQDHPFSCIFASKIRELQKAKRIPWRKAVEIVLS